MSRVICLHPKDYFVFSFSKERSNGSYGVRVQPQIILDRYHPQTGAPFSHSGARAFRGRESKPRLLDPRSRQSASNQRHLSHTPSSPARLRRHIPSTSTGGGAHSQYQHLPGFPGESIHTCQWTRSSLSERSGTSQIHFSHSFS